MHHRTDTRTAKFGHLIIGAMLSLSSVACAEHGEEADTQTVVSALTSTSYEAETLARTASAAGSKVTTETGASAGQYVQFNSSTPAVGDWIEFTLPNVAAGTYDVAMLYKSNTNRAIVQASIDGVNQGASCDQYAATPAFQVPCSLGTATLSSGNHLIRFTAIGKRSSSTSYLEIIDQISLTVSGGGSGAGGSGTGGRAPEVRAPEVQAPEVRAPEARAPEVRAPAGVPEEAAALAAEHPRLTRPRCWRAPPRRRAAR